MNGVEQTLIGGVDGGTAILLPALGELLGERAGVVNLGTEGAMLAGALSAYAVTQSSGYIALGLIAGVAGGALVGAAHSWVTIRRGGDQIASGLVLWFLALGITSVFGTTYVGTVITPLPNLAIPGFAFDSVDRTDPVRPRHLGLFRLRARRAHLVRLLSNPGRPDVAGDR